MGLGAKPIFPRPERRAGSKMIPYQLAGVRRVRDERRRIELEHANRIARLAEQEAAEISRRRHSSRC